MTQDTNAVSEMVLKGLEDLYNGIIVDSTALNDDPNVFHIQLQESLVHWSSKGKRGIWLKIPIEKSHLISIAAQVGFVFHHAQKNYVMMTHWLANTPSSIPNYASFYAGVGGFVLNDKNEVLVVSEKNGPITDLWKLPGGAVDAGEDICNAAVREVREETGIQCEFMELLCFRSDLYFLCRLKPLTQEISKQESEIKDCKWMPMDEFLALPYYRGLYRVMYGDISRDSARGNYHGFTTTVVPSGVRRGVSNHLYHSKNYVVPKARLFGELEAAKTKVSHRVLAEASQKLQPENSGVTSKSKDCNTTN